MVPLPYRYLWNFLLLITFYISLVWLLWDIFCLALLKGLGTAQRTITALGVKREVWEARGGIKKSWILWRCPISYTVKRKRLSLHGAKNDLSRPLKPSIWTSKKGLQINHIHFELFERMPDFYENQRPRPFSGGFMPEKPKISRYLTSRDIEFCVTGQELKWEKGRD